MDTCKKDMNIVIVGHVDHGKSTVIGRLLADTGSLPQGKLEQIKEMCRRNSKPFEYAFLLDALKDERAQGITIDIARCFFRTEKREYIILDAPGHIEFLKNMITGASRAEAALLVIDAHEGVRENSRRHGYILSMLGIKQVSVLVNKLDIMGYSEEVFDNIVKEYSEFLAAAGVTPTSFIPVSAAMGDNIAVRSDKMPWYDGMTVLEQLDAFKEELPPDDLPFRMPVQDVYKFTSSGDERRIIAGTVESGTLHVGDSIMFYPSGKKTTVASIEEFNRPRRTAVTSGYSTGITMTEQIYVRRGDLAVKTDEKPPVTASRIEVSLFWLGKDALSEGKRYYLKTGSAKVPMRLEKTEYVLNASSLEKAAKPKVEKNEVAKCTLTLERPISFDISSDLSGTGRFVIVDGYEISGGGIITGIPGDGKIQKDVAMRNFKWENGGVSPAERMKRFGQKPFVIMITGSKNSDRKTVARELEKSLFANGRSVYYLGIGNVLYGVDADIKTGRSEDRDERDEHIRRLAETANILTDAGLIVILTASEIDEDDVYLMQTVLGEKIFTVRVGNAYDKEPAFDLSVDENDEKAAETIMRSAESLRTAEL
ncbi:MAG: adenylyl-sulfate kinase [Clostridia bacterium]|nr:adenylyl-sulfate kinase [Clostridia bacterium]